MFENPKSIQTRTFLCSLLHWLLLRIFYSSTCKLNKFFINIILIILSSIGLRWINHCTEFIVSHASEFLSDFCLRYTTADVEVTEKCVYCLFTKVSSYIIQVPTNRYLNEPHRERFPSLKSVGYKIFTLFN